MRANEFTNFSYKTEPYEGWNGDGLVVRAYDDKTEVGHVIFEPSEDDNTQWYAVDVEVEEPYQRKGIATKMYDIAKKTAKQQGAIIVKSHTQTDAGRGLWQDKQVWEQISEEINLDCFNPAFNDTQEFDGLTYRATVEKEYGKPIFVIKVLDDNFNQIGIAKFKQSRGSVVSLLTAFKPEYQGSGIARNIYAYVRMLGNTIKPSQNQLPPGKAMWDSWKKSGDSKHLMK